MPHLNRKSAYRGLEDSQPLGVFEVAEDPSHAFAKV